MNTLLRSSRRYLLGFALAAFSASSFAASIDALYVLGDSLSDAGNRLQLDQTVTLPPFATPIPDSPYAYGGGRYSNGPVWVEYLAGRLGVPLHASALNGSDYAYGSARTGPLPGVSDNGIPSLLAQADQLIADVGTLSPQALVVVWGGGNDVRDAGTLAAGGDLAGASAVLGASIGNIGLAIATLAAHGATNFLVPNLPDLALIPAALGAGPAFQAGAHQLSLAFNGGLGMLLPQLHANLGVRITALDTFSLANDIVAHPGHYGFTDTTDGCAFANGGLGCGNPDAYLFWDALHPTTHFHEILANSAVPLPAALWLFAPGIGGLLFRRRPGVRDAAVLAPVALVLVGLSTWASPTLADSFQSSGRALQHSANAVGYALAGTTQLISGAAAIPLGFAGAVGQLSGNLSDELMKAANAQVGAPLPLTNENVTVGPPPSMAIQPRAGVRP